MKPFELMVRPIRAIRDFQRERREGQAQFRRFEREFYDLYWRDPSDYAIVDRCVSILINGEYPLIDRESIAYKAMKRLYNLREHAGLSSDQILDNLAQKRGGRIPPVARFLTERLDEVLEIPRIPGVNPLHYALDMGFGFRLEAFLAGKPDPILLLDVAS
ncbi:hypothetical protein HYS97_03345 [Candidatus Daviesbacteria bacterium]|nr:hypothetical protein [Candidatus Daviesbacteria bacterium]